VFFAPEKRACSDLPIQASFAAATFAGLFVGQSYSARWRTALGGAQFFTYSLLWYTAASIAMGLQHTNIGVDLWRFISGLGIGVELVTIDAYISELAPKRLRGRAFAVNQSVQFVAIPFVALVSWILVPRSPFGIAGWRWVVFLGSLGAIAIWFIRRSIPESPRWLAQKGRLEEADAAISKIEARVEAEICPSLLLRRTDNGLAERVAFQLDSRFDFGNCRVGFFQPAFLSQPARGFRNASADKPDRDCAERAQKNHPAHRQFRKESEEPKSRRPRPRTGMATN